MFQNITLEMSLKPFKQTDTAYIESVLKTMFEQWKPLVKHAKQVSVMLWTADGSEILEYKGDLDEPFEWCYFLGVANRRRKWNTKTDPEGVSLHAHHHLYIEHPPVMTYRILKTIIAAIKRVGKEMLGKDIRVGETFDPGPEFAKSDFKYNRHNEICTGADMGNTSMVCSYTRLHADSVPYAGFPDGIPEGLPFGTFLGRQCQHFLTDMGFDYIWLSNGIGFGRETWSPYGAVFDGETFDIGALPGVKQDVLEFWKLFRAECPDFPIETRGTNLTMGIDMATDGVPLKDIYDAVPNLLPPPNSPWAALDGDFGLEIAGYLSRVAEVPDDMYLFRYYIHDPWWVNSPWYDRYQGQPHDIYLPMAAARIDQAGNMKSPTHLNLLTVDNSYGDMPDACVYEPLPHLLKAAKDAPDQPSPVVWVYPFSQYSRASDEPSIREMYAGDWFIRGAINHGAPISSVVSADNFVKHKKEIYQTSILVSPVPEADSDYERAAIDYVRSGGKMIFYGTVARAGKAFLELVNVRPAGHPVSGELPFVLDKKPMGVIKHNPILCAGGIDTELLNDTGAVPYAYAGGKVVATAGKNCVWLRATCSCDVVKGKKLPVSHPEELFFHGEALLLDAISRLGYGISFHKCEITCKPPVLMLSKNDGALWFSVYLPDTTVESRFLFPLGAPVLLGCETKLKDGWSSYRFPKAAHSECRIFVEQKDGVVRARELPPVSHIMHRRIELSGLKDAIVRFFPERGANGDVCVVHNSFYDPYIFSEPFDGGFVEDEHGRYYEARHITGNLVFSLPKKK